MMIANPNVTSKMDLEEDFHFWPEGNFSWI